MDKLNTLDQRVTELEIKSSFADDLLDTLNATLFRQQEQIDMLIREVRALRQQGAAPDAQRQWRDEQPPHY